MYLRQIKLQSRILQLLIFLLVITIYVLLGSLGLEIATINKNASPIWPASGFAVGALLIFGRKMFPAIFLGAAITNYLVGTHPVGYLLVGLGNALESLSAYYIIHAIFKRNYFRDYTEFLSVSVTAILASMISATIAIVTLHTLGAISTQNVLYAWYTWWSGDAVGIFLVLPLMMEFGIKQRFKTSFNLKKIFSGLLTLLIFLGTIYSVFVKDSNQALVWGLVPFIIISGVKLGKVFTSLLLIIISSFIVFMSSQGYGPFEHGNMNQNLLYVQCLLACYAVALLFVSPLRLITKLKPRQIAGVAGAWVSIFLVIFIISVQERTKTREDFLKTAQSTLTDLRNGFRQYELLLEGASVAFGMQEQFDVTDWDMYIHSPHVKNFSEYLNSMGFIVKLDDKGLKLHEKRINHKIKLIQPDYARLFNDHYIILYHKQFSLQGKKVAPHHDLGSEPIRRSVITDSFRLKSTTFSEPIVFINRERGIGYLLSTPIFSKNNLFYGWIYATAKDSKLFGIPLKKNSHILSTKIFLNNNQVYPYKYKEIEYPEEPFQKSPYFLSQDLQIFDKNFHIQFYPTDLFFSRHTGYSAPLALLLNMFILFIFGFLLQQLNFGKRAQELVDRRTKELELSKMQLVQSSKMASLGEMASGMAHEINNPLTIIKGKVKVISMMLEDLRVNDPKIKEEVEKIGNTTERISKIVKGLKNFSRSSDQDPLEYIPLQVLITETLDLCFEKFKAHGIKLSVDHIPDVEVLCRPAEISQVLINLFNNSSDAIENFSPKWIEVNFLKLSSDRLAVLVTDCGPGIPDNIADKIMEPFFTTKDVRRGTGLGLSISQGIIESHGGTLKLDHKHHHTRFIFDLKYEDFKIG